LSPSLWVPLNLNPNDIKIPIYRTITETRYTHLLIFSSSIKRGRENAREWRIQISEEMDEMVTVFGTCSGVLENSLSW
jgi:hypothetical protein